VLLDKQGDDAEPNPGETDPVRKDHLRTLKALARVLAGKPPATSGMATEPGRRFADLWPTDPAALREKLRLPPRR
jgi:hypothetical protein